MPKRKFTNYEQAFEEHQELEFEKEMKIFDQEKKLADIYDPVPGDDDPDSPYFGLEEIQRHYGER